MVSAVLDSSCRHVYKVHARLLHSRHSMADEGQRMAAEKKRERERERERERGRGKVGGGEGARDRERERERESRVLRNDTP